VSRAYGSISTDFLLVYGCGVNWTESGQKIPISKIGGKKIIQFLCSLAR
jgi:Na+/citrate or Na+/malate symporter